MYFTGLYSWLQLMFYTAFTLFSTLKYLFSLKISLSCPFIISETATLLLGYERRSSKLTRQSHTSTQREQAVLLPTLSFHESFHESIPGARISGAENTVLVFLILFLPCLSDCPHPCSLSTFSFPVHSELAHIGFIAFGTFRGVLRLSCLSCVFAVTVCNFYHLWLPVSIKSASECKMCCN